MYFKPDKCPDCGSDWNHVEENNLVFTFVARDEGGDYDWSLDHGSEQVGDSEPVKDDKGRVTAHCEGMTDNVHIHQVELSPDKFDDGDERPVLVNITWTEQHNATVTVAGPPESIDAGSVVDLFEDAYDRFKEEQDRNRTFQQVTQVHEWEVVDE